MGHDAHAGAQGFPKPHYKQYFVILALLGILTVIEVLMTMMPINKGLMISGLTGLALVKAGMVGLFYMHLKYETPVLRWTVIVPLMLPFLYALVLIGEAAWRLTQLHVRLP